MNGLVGTTTLHSLNEVVIGSEPLFPKPLILDEQHHFKLAKTQKTKPKSTATAGNHS